MRDHLGARDALAEVARDGDDEVLRVDPLPVERDEVVAGDPLEGGLRRVAVRVVALAEGEEAPLALLDVGGVVVAGLHVGEELVLAELQLVVLEAGLGERLAQDREPLVEVLGEEVEGDGAAVDAVARVELGGEEGEPLLELLGRLRLRPAAGEEVAGQLGEPFLPGGAQVACRRGA